MTIILFRQLHYRPADIPHSSLRTMAKDVRRAMLPNNDEVLKKSFAEGIEHKHTFKMSMGWFRVMFFPGLDGNQVLDLIRWTYLRGYIIRIMTLTCIIFIILFFSDSLMSCYMLHHRPSNIIMSLAQRSAGSPWSLLTWVQYSDWGFKVSNKYTNH